jgi:hypothetical protein
MPALIGNRRAMDGRSYKRLLFSDLGERTGVRPAVRLTGVRRTGGQVSGEEEDGAKKEARDIRHAPLNERRLSA